MRPPSSRRCSRPSVLPSGILTGLVLVELVVALLERRARHRARRAGVVVGLERFQQLVAALLVDRHLIRDPDPLGALVGLHVEDALVDRRRVVDDHQDLGLGIEVGPRADRQLLELRDPILQLHLRLAAHWPRFSSSRSWRSTSASTSNGSWPLRARRSLRATTSWRTSVRSSSSRPSDGAGRSSSSLCTSASMSSGASPRACWRYDFASTIWRISASRTSVETGTWVPALRCGSSCSIANGPLPIWRSADPAPRTNMSAATGIATKPMISSTSPFDSASGTTRQGYRRGHAWE